jgi:hypothetical protein
MAASRSFSTDRRQLLSPVERPQENDGGALQRAIDTLERARSGSEPCCDPGVVLSEVERGEFVSCECERPADHLAPATASTMTTSTRTPGGSVSPRPMCLHGRGRFRRLPAVLQNPRSVMPTPRTLASRRR